MLVEAEVKLGNDDDVKQLAARILSSLPVNDLSFEELLALARIQVTAKNIVDATADRAEEIGEYLSRPSIAKHDLAEFWKFAGVKEKTGESKF